jgi:hypothetical protein
VRRKPLKPRFEKPLPPLPMISPLCRTMIPCAIHEMHSITSVRLKSALTEKKK